jgi:hypothetical protein
MMNTATLHDTNPYDRNWQDRRAGKVMLTDALRGAARAKVDALFGNPKSG